MLKPLFWRGPLLKYHSRVVPHQVNRLPACYYTK